MGNDNSDDVLELLEKKLAEAKRQVLRLETTLAAYRETQNQSDLRSSSKGSTASVTPPIVDICQYLAAQGKPVPQNELVRVIGDLRQQRYPALSNHYSNVWRALEYHVRHNKVIRCVDEEGYAAKLKPLPGRPKGKKLFNTPELYEGDNWFVLKEQIKEENAAHAHKSSDAFGMS